STPAASIAYYRDTRNNQTYKIKKMVDNKCWMVDNLKYTNTTIDNTADSTTGMTYNSTSGKYNTVDGTSTQSTTNSDKAFYNNPMSKTECYSSTYAPANTLTNCGYLYNWYAATNGTGKYANAADTQATGSICPTNFRLPSGSSAAGGPTTNGTVYTAADFPVLNASMSNGSLATGNTTNTPTGWQPSGAWGGSFSGSWGTSLANQGSNGYFWSSTAYSSTNARYARFLSSTVNPGSNLNNKLGGFAVRCVLP
ncbi:MAG: fibrobacter succinogenes major paralogous domain-containing protein, partial [Candidatus Nomurabacteria bacterium]|nr:fibrobacter succinogenes major paralogous domain-containing protein [Candidatus Nomurabacteria bacterium]